MTQDRDEGAAARTNSAVVQRAQGMVSAAIRKGTLVRRPCEECGAVETHAHHDDYTKPLDVRWLCARHHRLAHPGVKSAAPRSIISQRQFVATLAEIEEPMLVMRQDRETGSRVVIGAWFPAWTLDELEGRNG